MPPFSTIPKHLEQLPGTQTGATILNRGFLGMEPRNGIITSGSLAWGKARDALIPERHEPLPHSHQATDGREID
jgi:hypothetical protein